MSALGSADAARLDAEDPLAAMRDRFSLPAGIAYFAGNSLGAPGREVAARLARTVEGEWGGELVRGWQRWIELPRRLAGGLAPLLGVEAEEVAVADSTTVNLFKLVGALLAADSRRQRVVALAGGFPSDLYAAEGAAALAGGELVVAEAGELAGVLPTAAALVVSHVDFRSGELHDLRALAALARSHGALLVADLSHSVGAMPLRLAEWGVELAVGCTYKFLGGGPGSPAFLVVARGLQGSLVPPLRGWMGHAEPFAFEQRFRPAPGVDRFLCGTPPILAFAALEAALDLFAEVDLAACRHKVERLGDLFVTLVEQRLASAGVELASPRAAAHRGAQISLRHPEAYALSQALIERGVVGDFRAPDLLRFGLPSLTLRFADVWRAVDELATLLATGAHRSTPVRPARVT